MKRVLYSNHSDEIIKSINSNKVDFNIKKSHYESTINQISNIFQTENNVLNEVAENTDLETKKNKSLVQISDKIMSGMNRAKIENLNLKISQNKILKKSLFNHNVLKSNTKSLNYINQQFLEAEQRVQKSKINK